MPYACPHSALSRSEEPLLGHVTELSAASRTQGLCRGSTRLLTRNFGLCTLELVELLQKPARPEHGSLNGQSLVLSHRGTRWDKCKCPNADVHRLKTQARRGSIGRVAQRRQGCQTTHAAGPGDGTSCPAPEARRGRMGHGQEARLTLFCKSCLRMYLDAPAQTLQISGKQRKGRHALSQQRTTIQHSPTPGGDNGVCSSRPSQTLAAPGLPSCVLDHPRPPSSPPCAPQRPGGKSSVLGKGIPPSDMGSG